MNAATDTSAGPSTAVDLETFRATTAAFLRDAVEMGVACPAYGAILVPALHEEARVWQRYCYDHGWAGLHWPTEYGGRGLTRAHTGGWMEECDRASGAPYLNLQGIVLDADREAVFRAVKARLHPRGCYLVSSAMYAATRHRPDRQVVDGRTGRAFARYDETSLFDPATDIYYLPYDGKVQIDGATRVNGSWYYPFRRYRTGPRLSEEVESYGFKVIHQSGELGQHLVAVHRESGGRFP